MTNYRSKHQDEAVKAALSFFRKHRCGLIWMPVRTGKTRVGLRIVDALGGNAVIVTPRIEIVEQWIETGQRLMPTRSFGRYTGSQKQPANVTIGTIVSVANGMNELTTRNQDILVFDEAQHVMSPSGQLIVDTFLARTNGKVLFLTATPGRSDGESLSKYSEGIIYSVDHDQAIRHGILVNFKHIDLQDTSSEGLVDAVIRNAKGKKTIVFTGSGAHPEIVASMLREKGIKAAAITSYTPKRNREKYLREYQNGDLQVIVNILLMTEGIDVNMTEVIVLADRPKTPTPLIQRIGRALGGNEWAKKNALVIAPKDQGKIRLTNDESWRDREQERYNGLGSIGKLAHRLFKGETRYGDKRNH